MQKLLIAGIALVVGILIVVAGFLAGRGKLQRDEAEWLDLKLPKSVGELVTRLEKDGWKWCHLPEEKEPSLSWKNEWTLSLVKKGVGSVVVCGSSFEARRWSREGNTADGIGDYLAEGAYEMRREQMLVVGTIVERQAVEASLRKVAY